MKTQLESTKEINKVKFNAIKRGGYAKHSEKILSLCAAHKAAFGTDLTPAQLLK